MILHPDHMLLYEPHKLAYCGNCLFYGVKRYECSSVRLPVVDMIR